MKHRRLRNTALSTALGLGVLALAFSTASATDDAPPSIKKVMQVLNKGGNAASGKLKKALSSGSPDWTTIKDSSKQFAELGTTLGKNDPPKGGADSWKSLTESYATDCKALDVAAQKEDLAGTKAAFQKLSTSCMTCHKSHKG